MAEITAALVKELREKTGVGMMDCKKALTENNGDVEASVDWLRKQGLSQAAKKAGRAASEGLVGIAVSGSKAGIVEINSETDFVARNEQFQEFVATVASKNLDGDGDVEALKSADYSAGDGTIGDKLANLIATIGENMDLRRSAILRVGEGVISSYMHNSVQDGLGKIGVLVALESSGDAGKLDALGKQIAMHVAASNPQALSRDDVDQAETDRERDILADQARASGKPEEIIEKMVEGRMRKFYEDVCLLEQTYVVDGESKVGKVVEAVADDIGAAVKITGFVRFALGDGVEKKEEDFAAEVAAVAGS